MEFVAIDVETANADMSSICQIGIASYKNKRIEKEWMSYVNPEDYFDAVNISIHGIDEEKVKSAPKLHDIANEIYKYLDNHICVCHTHFDRVSIGQAFEKYKIRHPNCTWLDSARVARRTWREFTYRGYGLENICRHLGYNFVPHDALEDAKAAAKIFIAAIDKTGLNIDDWLKRVEQPIDINRLNYRQSIKKEGNPEGNFYGEILVFTGALDIPRREAAGMAAKIGCQVCPSVTQDTTILVVGDQDIKRLAGHQKSVKHRKVEELIRQGKQIKIIMESDFKRLVDYD
jgi:DNA polymerase-3 subunit epsilon